MRESEISCSWKDRTSPRRLRRVPLGHAGNIYEIREEGRPDIIVLGFDQAHDENRILEECGRRGLGTRVVRLPKFEGDLDGTRKIVREVGEWLALHGEARDVRGGRH